MSTFTALKDALDAVPHRAQERPASRLAPLGPLPNEVATRLQLVSDETLNLVAALASTYRGEEPLLPFGGHIPQFPAEHKHTISALCGDILAAPDDLENRVLAFLQPLHAALTLDLDELRRYERVHRLLSNLVLKSQSPGLDLFEGVW